MKSLISLLVVASGLSQTNAQCRANNCLRAVTGTQRPEPNPSSRREDCSSVQKFTFIPATTTSTIYTTVTPVTIFLTSTLTVTTASGTTTITLDTPNKRQPDAVGLDRRQTVVTPTAVPAYASPCANIAEYRSACSCWGVTATTITVASPTALTTSTITTTATSSFTETETATIPAATATACGVGLTLCSGRCKDLKRDSANCGACGNICPSGGGCGNGYCANPSCTNPSTCTAQSCNSPASSCFCVTGVEGRFCASGFYGSCTSSPQCTTSADCPADGVCVLSGSTCCSTNICFPIGAQGSTCDNIVVPTRLFKRINGAATVPVVAMEGMLEAREDGDSEVWPLRFDKD